MADRKCAMCGLSIPDKYEAQSYKHLPKIRAYAAIFKVWMPKTKSLGEFERPEMDPFLA
jgi:hypothetical protein